VHRRSLYAVVEGTERTRARRWEPVHPPAERGRVVPDWTREDPLRGTTAGAAGQTVVEIVVDEVLDGVRIGAIAGSDLEADDAAEPGGAGRGLARGATTPGPAPAGPA
jgi:hypothetical protein